MLEWEFLKADPSTWQPNTWRTKGAMIRYRPGGKYELTVRDLDDFEGRMFPSLEAAQAQAEIDLEVRQ